MAATPSQQSGAHEPHRSDVELRNPKITAARPLAHDQYYAGYSTEFVHSVLASHTGGPSLRVLDPWNGAGTTTYVAHARGLLSTGVDANPFMRVVAKARLLSADVEHSLEPLLDDILGHTNALKIAVPTTEEDPLLWWFTPESATHIRRVRAAITHVLERKNRTSVPEMSSLAAFYHVALASAVRRLVMTQFASSNPTWVRTARQDEDRFEVSADALHLDIARYTAAQLAHLADVAGTRAAAPELLIADSTKLPLIDASADLVITSPPYLTRIDYVKATLPELASTGLTVTEIAALRTKLIGTTVTPKRTGVTRLPRAVQHLLKSIAEHPSKASGTYYFRYHAAYFARMQRSFRELARVVRPGGSAYLVVQDSYYKEIHVDLPALLAAMARPLGWTETARRDFPVRSNMANLNTHARGYRGTISATETVLIWQR